jgi:hypothetical protein
MRWATAISSAGATGRRRPRAGGPGKPRERALIWRANYHPDGGQLFHPLKGQSFVVPLALPGDDVTPEKFVTFWCDGNAASISIPISGMAPSCPMTTTQSSSTARDRVHARVSVDFPKEFGCYLATPLGRP